MHRLAYIVTHPIQYQAPLLRLISEDPEIELKVFFLDDFSLKEHYERGFGQRVTWDVPLVEGYDSEIVARGGVFLDPIRALRLKRIFRRGNFDAIWVHGWGRIALLSAVNSAQSLGIPVLLRGEATVFSSKSVSLREFRGRLLRRLFSRVSAFLYIGSLNREFYLAHGIPEARLFSTPYAVDNDWFQSRCIEAASKREYFRSQLQLEPGRKVILFAAKFIPEKGVDDLLAAYIELTRVTRDNVPYLLLAGDGPLRNELEIRAGELAGNFVRFLGFQNQTELPALYDLCDVFVLPSKFEPWGLVVNEVMNAARAVIVSDRVGAAPDLICAGENGWIFPAGNVEALTNCLREAVTSGDLARMGSRSRELISDWNYDADVKGLKAALAFVTTGGKA